MTQTERTKMIRKFIIKMFPDIVYDEKTSLKAIKNLNEKLQREKKNAKMWRQRALETERFMALQKRNAEELAREFDSKHGTNISFRVF